MISILLASADRPEMAEAFTRSLIDSTAGHSIELVAAVDGDHETVDRIHSVAEGSDLRISVDYAPEYRGCSRAWNTALARSTGDPVVLAADDLVFESGWLDAALETLAGFPDGWGFVGFNDGHWGAELSTHYLMSRRLINEVFGGAVAWEAYVHSFNDVEANERAKRAGRYAWCENARVRHNHWLWGDRAQDDTDTRSLPGHAESQRAYELRASAGFPDEVIA